MFIKGTVATASLLFIVAAANSTNAATTLHTSNTTLSHASAHEAGTCGSPVLNVDLLGNDIGSASQFGWGECLNLCRNKPLCNAVTWTDYRGGTCWIKSSNSGVGAYREEAVTWLLTTGCKQGGIMIPQCDMVGKDLQSTRGARYQDCIIPCSSIENCRGFTWSDYNGGTCWFKSWIVPCVQASNKYSFAMALGNY